MGQIKGRRHPDNSWPDDMAPGDFFHLTDEGNRMLVFGCPKGTGDCHVPIRPGENVRGASWGWDGNEDAPTLTPSIHCHNCGWHGFLRKGIFEGV